MSKIINYLKAERSHLVFLAVIVILGFGLRFAYQTYNPPSLNWDEVSHGYNAYSVLKTGMDQWGQKFPIFNFRAYGDYPTTLNLYLTIPFIVIFGLTDFAIRFPHVLLGTFTIISVYFLALGIAKRKDISLLAAFLTAIGPWYVFTSRFVVQSNLSVFFLITAAALFVNRDKGKKFLYLSVLSLFFTLFSYHTTRIVSPVLLLGTILIFWKEFVGYFRKGKLVAGILATFLLMFFVLAAIIIKNPESTARSGVLSILNQGAINKIESQRNSSKIPTALKKVIYNKPVYFAGVFTKNYINYFSPQFLFLQGGTQFQFSVPDRGLNYLINFPLFYIGLVLLVLKSLKDKNYRFLLLWLIISPIPAAITNESFTVIRATTMLPIPDILAAIGLYWLVGKTAGKYKWIILTVYFVALYIFMERYLINYFTGYRTNYSWSWQYGYEQIVDYSKEHYNEYDNIIVTKKYGEPHEYFLFFLGYDPSKYQKDPNKITFFQSDWYWVDRFDKFWFVNDWQVKLNSPELSSIQETFVTESKYTIDCTKSKCLLITSPDNFPPGWRKLDTINFLDGKPAFEIFDNSR